MRSNRTSQGRGAVALISLALAAACAIVLAAPATAAPSSGNSVIRTADHDRGRTLSGQGGVLLPAAGTSATGDGITLPIPQIDTQRGSASHAGNLKFRKGKRGVALTGIHFDFAAGTLNGRLGGTEMAVFKLGAHPYVDPGNGSIRLGEGVLRFTREAAEVVRRKLGLERALRHDGVGMIWLSALARPAPPTPTPPAPYAPPHPVTSGGLDWGVLGGWRSYVLGFFGPGSEGSIATEGGATSTGTLSEAGAHFSFPAAGGVYRQGLGGNPDQLELSTAGSVTFAKPGHCIIEVRFSEIDVKIAGAGSSLTLDSIYDIDTPPSCTDKLPVATDGVLFATLDMSGVSPVYSDEGSTVTWPEIPAKLTEAGGAAWGAGYEGGEELDPVTITVGL